MSYADCYWNKIMNKSDLMDYLFCKNYIFTSNEISNIPTTGLSKTILKAMGFQDLALI